MFCDTSNVNCRNRYWPMLIVLGLCSCFIAYLVSYTHLPQTVPLADKVAFTNLLTESAYHTFADPLNRIAVAAAISMSVAFAYGIWLFSVNSTCHGGGYSTATFLMAIAVVSVPIIVFLFVHGTTIDHSSISGGLPTPGYQLSDIFNTT